jgi:hypothetical protein
MIDTLLYNRNGVYRELNISGREDVIYIKYEIPRSAK